MDPRPQSSPRTAARLFYIGALILTTWLQSTNATASSGILLADASTLDTSLGDQAQIYQPEFGMVPRQATGDIKPRSTLKNNVRESSNLAPGDTACYKVDWKTLPAADKEGARNELRAVEAPDEVEDGDPDSKLKRRQQASKTLYVSTNTCRRPRAISPDNANSNSTQLILLISADSDGCPDPNKKAPGVRSISFDEGAAMFKTDINDDIFISVTAPDMKTQADDVYNFELAISTDDYYHQYDDPSQPELAWIDSDANSVLLRSRSLTDDPDKIEEIMGQQMPYTLFVQKRNSTSLVGFRHSMCGLERQQGIEKQNVTITTQDPEGMPKQQFFLQGLDTNSSYVAILMKPPKYNKLADRQDNPGSIGGGGTVFKELQFETTAETNCVLIPGFEFCDEIAYAVPGNGEKFDINGLREAYDNQARQNYKNFEKVMMQIPCDIEDTAQYSLARNCDDCKEAYKRWLCTVSIPRCLPFASSHDSAIVRNAGQAFPNGTLLPETERETFAKSPQNNASRNAFIDTEIQPGPYLEVLPCDNICYGVVQSCPATINFMCPRPGMPGFDGSYAQKDDSASLACNYPGAARSQVNGADVALPGKAILVAAVIIGPLFLVLA